MPSGHSNKKAKIKASKKATPKARKNKRSTSELYYNAWKTVANSSNGLVQNEQPWVLSGGTATATSGYVSSDYGNYATGTVTTTGTSYGNYTITPGSYATFTVPEWTTTINMPLTVSSGTLTWGSPDKMLFDNDFVEINDKGEVLINGKLELNPTKIGRALLKALENKFEKNRDLNDPQDFFNKG